MTSASCSGPISFDELVDYSAGDLSPERESALETHVFECAPCARKLDWIFELKRGVVDLVRQGAVQASVTAQAVKRAEDAGLTLRRYVVAPGDSVACTAAPDDAFVVVELTLGARRTLGPARVEVEFEALSGEHGVHQRRSIEALVDADRNAVILLFPGERVRSFPKSRWTMRMSFGSEPALEQPAYVMNHTPWQQLEPARD